MISGGGEAGDVILGEAIPDIWLEAWAVVEVVVSVNVYLSI